MPRVRLLAYSSRACVLVRLFVFPLVRLSARAASSLLKVHTSARKRILHLKHRRKIRQTRIEVQEFIRNLYTLYTTPCHAMHEPSCESVVITFILWSFVCRGAHQSYFSLASFSLSGNLRASASRHEDRYITKINPEALTQLDALSFCRLIAPLSRPCTSAESTASFPSITQATAIAII